MKYVYGAVFHPSDEGYQVTVPDLPGYVTWGESLADALEMAQDAMEMWLWDAENKGEAIPPARPQGALTVEGGDFVTLICADTDRYRRENDTRAVKKTLSVPLWLNAKAEKANAPFSQILQEGLKQYLGLRDQ